MPDFPQLRQRKTTRRLARTLPKDSSVCGKMTTLRPAVAVAAIAIVDFPQKRAADEQGGRKRKRVGSRVPLPACDQPDPIFTVGNHPVAVPLNPSCDSCSEA